jgi:D-arabinose 1-dehydrogenase-like Zn-dependent alcohol dehydrogenase
MCAGLTTFNMLRNSGERPGDVVAVPGLGGLGCAFRTNAIGEFRVRL